MMPDGGYRFAPAHALQDNSPTGNVVAYETALNYGKYLINTKHSLPGMNKK